MPLQKALYPRLIVGATFILCLQSNATGQTCAVISAPQPLNSNAHTDSEHDFLSHIAADGLGVWLVTWFSAENLDGRIGTDRDILYVRSADDGMTWTDPQPLNTSAYFDGLASDTGCVLAHGMGTWLAVWTSSYDLGGSVGTDRDIFISRSTDDGQTWSESRVLNGDAVSDTKADSFPHLDTDGAGNWIAVWHRNVDDHETHFSPHTVMFARSSDNGATWSHPLRLSSNHDSSTITDTWPIVRSDGLDTWISAWSSTNDLSGTIGSDRDVLFRISQDGGAHWSSVNPLNTNAENDEGNDTKPQLAADGDGNWLAVWHSNDDLNDTVGEDLDIFFSRSSDHGWTWSEPLPLNDNAHLDHGADSAPQVTTDLAGTWLVVWHSNDDLGGTIGDDVDILFSRSMDNAVSWSSPRPFNTNAVSDDFVSPYNTDSDPHVGTDHAGRWTVVWVSTNHLEDTIGTDQDLLFANLEFVPGECACLGNLDGDDVVGPFDLSVLLGDWGVCSPNTDCPADLDEDGVVGAEDLNLLLQRWGPCPA